MRTTQPPATTGSPAPQVNSDALADSARKRRRGIRIVWTIRIVLLVGVVGSWEFAGRAGVVNPVFYGSPLKIWPEFWDGVTGDLVTVQARATLTATLVGSGIAGAAGIALAYVVSQLPLLRRALDPLLTALNALPRIALAPLFLMWFGIGLSSKMALAGSLTFFVTFYSTLAGIDSVDHEHVRLVRTLGASRTQMFRKVIMPAAMPGVLAGIQLGFVYGMLGSVAGEMIAGRVGLGVALTRQAALFQTDAYFATLMVLVIVTVIFTGALELIRRRLLAWQEFGK